jgi:hypothetical protein
MYLADPARAHAACAFHGRGGPAGPTHLHELQITEPGFKTGASDLFLLGEQLRASLGEFHVSAAFMHHQPAALDREAGVVFGRRRLVFEQHRAIEQLDIDPAVQHGLYRTGGRGCGKRTPQTKESPAGFLESGRAIRREDHRPTGQMTVRSKLGARSK